MNNSFYKKILVSVACMLIALITFSSVTSVNAYSLWDRKINNKQATYRWGSEIDYFYSYKASWRSGFSDWNNATYATFSYNANSNNVFETWSNPANSAYGETEAEQFGGVITKFTGWLNRGHSGMDNATVARSVACHELGHLLGLDDLSFGNALMSHSRNRYSIYKPQSDDVNGVYAAYGW